MLVIGRLFARIARVWAKPCVVAPTPPPAPEQDIWGRPYTKSPVLVLPNGARIGWLMRDAVTMELWRAEGERLTCAEIAERVSARDKEYGLGAQVSPAQVNAALSGISIRTNGCRFADDRDDPKTQSREWGLSMNWPRRRWRITPDGIGRAKTISAAKSRRLEVFAEMTARAK